MHLNQFAMFLKNFAVRGGSARRSCARIIVQEHHPGLFILNTGNGGVQSPPILPNVAASCEKEVSLNFCRFGPGDTEGVASKEDAVRSSEGLGRLPTASCISPLSATSTALCAPLPSAPRRCGCCSSRRR